MLVMLQVKDGRRKTIGRASAGLFMRADAALGIWANVVMEKTSRRWQRVSVGCVGGRVGQSLLSHRRHLWDWES